MSQNKNEKTATIPVIPLRGITVFPGIVFSFDISRKKSLKGLEQAAESNHIVFLVPQREPDIDSPAVNDLYEIGVIVEVKQFFKSQGGSLRVVVEGLNRGKLLELSDCGEIWSGLVETVEDTIEVNGHEHSYYNQALIRSAKDHFETLNELYSSISAESLYTIMSEESMGLLADLIMANMPADFEHKQRVLEALDPVERLEKVVVCLVEEIEILTAQKGILDKVRKNIDKAQKEYYLREQLKAIQEELDEDSELKNEVNTYLKQIDALNDVLQETDILKLKKEAQRLLKMSASSPEATVIRNYMDWITALPWQYKTKESFSMNKAERVINQNHYGLEKVKERILEFLAVRNVAPATDTPILCLVGPPGSGKTSVAASVAEALKRSYVRMSLGGVRDEAEIRGHRKTYIGAMPGRIISAMKQAGSKNPLILFDEIDKLSSDYKGDPASALLEVLDAAQNHSFRDNYIEVPFDLSDVLFICTANDLSAIAPALRDRLEVIELSGYSEYEKLAICKKHLIPKQLTKHGLKKIQLRFTNDAITQMITCYTRESGVRQLERLVSQVCRKSVRKFMQSDQKRITVTPSNIHDFLGQPKYHHNTPNDKPEIGVVNGLAWTGYGGDTLSIEATVMKGTGKFELTGNMGLVMKESAKAAISFIRSNIDELQINEKFYKDSDIHIHIPEGAIPKDGPSAGITMATAMISALTLNPVAKNTAMTGEITIRGNILPVGGLKEKLLAAKRNGIKTVLLPYKNQNDLSELTDEVLEGITIHLVSTMAEVIEKVFVAED